MQVEESVQQGREIKRGKWDSCNSILNKIYFKIFFKKEVQKVWPHPDLLSQHPRFNKVPA